MLLDLILGFILLLGLQWYRIQHQSMNIKMPKSLFQLAIQWHIVLPDKIETLQFVLGNEAVVVIVALDACESKKFEQFLS
jgi:hypothetical protein